MNARYWYAENRGTLFAFGLYALMFAIYLANYPSSISTNVILTAANKAVLLALVSMGQALVVLTNCVASWLVAGDAVHTAAGVVGVLAVGALCGALNGAIIIFGRLQPIVTTIATGAVFYGVALLLRPVPGGAINDDLADALTGKIAGVVPASLVILLAAVLIVWTPFKRSTIGRAAYAAGSSESAAYLSGMPIRRAKFASYVLAGLLAAIGGLFLTFFTDTGEASVGGANSYTLFSIAAVVIGGVSLLGGKGSAIGAIFGAFAFRSIGDLLFVFNVDALWQPLFQGVILLIAVAIGACGLFRVRNRLEWFQQ